MVALRKWYICGYKETQHWSQMTLSSVTNPSSCQHFQLKIPIFNNYSKKRELKYILDELLEEIR